MVPYLKGFHLTIDGWRSNRNEFGWKMSQIHLKLKDDGKDSSNLQEDASDYPSEVKPVPRFIYDLHALHLLTETTKPPVLIIQLKNIYVVKYGFGDSSVGGFGSSVTHHNDLNVHFGTWNKEGSKSTSNFR